MKLTRSLHRELALIVIVSALWYGCGGSTLLKSFRVALASSGPLVNSLVNAGVIDQSKAAAITADFTDAANCGLVLQEAFSAISKDLPASEVKSRKFQASLTGLQCFRGIAQRQNFASNPKIQNVTNIAEGILASLVAFYQIGPTAEIARARHITIARDEKDLEEKLKQKVKDLEAALKP